ncbi:MAG TPA: hypothetical protein VFG25_08205 [Nitrosopumilaceae archaeon]|nr:hypothetical protein [Nitrosopumilaceae archaeon]
MASKKGIFLTIGILVAITIASFTFWFLPQNSEMTFVVSDFESNLDGIKNIHKAISESIDMEFQNLLNEDISPQEYIDLAQSSTEQINSIIIQLVESKPTEEWLESYINYVESLKQYNSYVRETIVIANMIEDGVESSKIDEAISKINQFKENSESHALKSDNSRP